MWLLEIELRTFGRAVSAPNLEPSLQPSRYNLLEGTGSHVAQAGLTVTLAEDDHELSSSHLSLPNAEMLVCASMPRALPPPPPDNLSPDSGGAHL